MFRWCSYCQSFLGETAPFDDYQLTHGMCGDCEIALGAHPGTGLPESTLIAKQLMELLFSVFENGDSLDCQHLVQEARQAGISRAEIMLGLLQPALYEIGERWKSAKISPSQEDLFTSWCKRIYFLITMDTLPTEKPDILLATMPGNMHTLGINFLKVFLHDHGFSCKVIDAPPTSQSIVHVCIQDQIKLCGISVCLTGGVPSAIRLAEEIERQTKEKTRVVLGGFAFRMEEGSPKLRIPTFALLENFTDYVETLMKGKEQHNDRC